VNNIKLSCSQSQQDVKGVCVPGTVLCALFQNCLLRLFVIITYIVSELYVFKILKCMNRSNSKSDSSNCSEQ